MNGLISPDKLISVWILVYFILYKLKLVKYNPIILFYIGLLFVIFGCFYVLIYGKITNRVLLFIFVNLFIKVIPIILIYKDKIQSSDMVFTCIYIIVYMLYLAIVKDNAIDLYRDIIINLVDDKKGRQVDIFKYMNDKLINTL